MMRWRVQLVMFALLGAGWLAKATADAPPLRYTIDAVAGTVRDTRTGLTWQRSVPPMTYGWAEARSYCEGLTLAGGNWRMPTCKELLTIVDPTRYNPAVDPAVFPDTPAELFWTSSPYLGVAGYAWYVQFVGGSSNANVTSFAYRVRCVR